MKNKIIGRVLFVFFVVSLQVNAQQKDPMIKLLEKATGEDYDAYKHEDKFTEWERLDCLWFFDPTISTKTKFFGPYVYYRQKICTTIANKKTGSIAHSLATIEVKAPDDIDKYGAQGITGNIIIVGKEAKANLDENDRVNLETGVQMTNQLFFVSPTEREFSIKIPLNYYVHFGSYLWIKEEWMKVNHPPMNLDLIRETLIKRIKQKPAVMGVRG